MTRSAPSSPLTHDLTALIAAEARKTAEYPFKRWGFGKSIAMDGLLAAGGEPGRRHARRANPPAGPRWLGVSMRPNRRTHDDRWLNLHPIRRQGATPSVYVPSCVG